VSKKPPTLHTTRLATLGRASARHPWRFLLVWALISGITFAVAVLGVAGGSLFSRLGSGEPGVGGEAHDGRAIVERVEPSSSSLMLQLTGIDLTSPQVASVATKAVADIMAIDGVKSAVNPFVFAGGPTDPQAAPFVRAGSDRSGMLTVTTFDPGLSKADTKVAEAAVSAVYDRMTRELPSGAQGAVGGGNLLLGEILHQIEVDLRAGEGIALPLSFIVMVLVFGGFIAAGMPIVGAIASIFAALGALYGFSYVMDLDASVVNVVTLLGLALCIDYGLLIVSRAREELRAQAAGRPAAELTPAEIQAAIGQAVATAGRTVFFSGLTVAIALSGLLIFDAHVIRAIGAAGVSVVLIAMIVGLTLVPPLCALGAHRLLAKGTETAPEDGVFSSLARGVHRVPWLVIAGCLALLVALAIPTLSMRLTSSGAELMPVGTSQRDFFDRLAADYPLMSAPAATVVGRTSVAAATAYAQEVRALPGVTGVSVRPLGSEYAAVSVRTTGPALGDPARDVVTQLREHRPLYQSWVTGQAAGLIDFTASLAARAPYAAALIVIGTFVLLFLMTGSVVIPTKALLLNVLSLGASLGVATWIFQEGHLQGLLGFTSTGALESMIPPLALTFGFGLSMDYELFLISRIAELYHHNGHDNDRAVELGLQRSGRIITSAALLVVIVFAGFIAGKMLVIKQMGVALTVAVLLDATIVRMLLVPATMSILGRWNWWAPAPLRRWHALHGTEE